MLTQYLGGNTGVGFETAKALVESERSYHILLAARSSTKGEQAVADLKSLNTTSTISLVELDVTSDQSIAEAVKQVQSLTSHIDALVNNAGKLNSTPHWSVTLRDTFETNVFGAIAVTEAFRPLLLQSMDPRLLFITSGLGSLTGTSNPQSSLYTPVTGMQHTDYRMSKAAINMATVQYTKELASPGIKVFSVNPGPNRTGLLGTAWETLKAQLGEERFNALAEQVPLPSKGGKVMAEVVEGKRDADAGKVVGSAGVGEW